ncbi:MAG: hypothetical protein QXJ75_02760 [Candidatus Bathyarchaeia archaeon]
MIKASVEGEGRRFSTILVEFVNVVFGFFYEGEEEKVGTMAISLPKTRTTPATSSIVMGAKNTVPARMLAEFLAQKYAKIAFASVFTYREDDFATNRWLLKLAREIETKREQI